MSNVQRIKTKRSIADRMFEYFETSWVPVALMYVCIAAAVVAANWPI